MKTLMLLAALSTASPAFAELPLSAVYGDPVTCELFAQGGTRAVAGGGGGGGGAGLLVTKSDIVGLEWGCYPETDSLGPVVLKCSGEGEEWTESATITVKGDTLTYTNEDGPTELHRCPASSDPATM